MTNQKFNIFLEFYNKNDDQKYSQLYRKSFPVIQFCIFHIMILFLQLYRGLRKDLGSSSPIQILPLRIINWIYFFVLSLNGCILVFFHYFKKLKETFPMSWEKILNKLEIIYLIAGPMYPGFTLLIRCYYSDGYCIPDVELCNIFDSYHYLPPLVPTMTLFAPYAFTTFLNSPHKLINLLLWVNCILVLIVSIILSQAYNSSFLVLMAVILFLNNYQSEKQNVLAFLAFMQASETENKLDLSVKAMEMKRAYYRYISHEIRTPLSVANLGLNLIESEVQSLGGACSRSIEIKANVKYCRDAVQSAVSILNDLIDNEKLESKLLNLESESQNFSPILSSVMGPFMLMSREKRISLSVDFAVDRYFNLPGLSTAFPMSSSSSILFQPMPTPSFPSPESSLPLESVLPSGLIFADQHKIAQVVRNLVSNALKFTPKGGEVAILVSYLTQQNPLAAPFLPPVDEEDDSIEQQPNDGNRSRTFSGNQILRPKISLSSFFGTSHQTIHASDDDLSVSVTSHSQTSGSHPASSTRESRLSFHKAKSSSLPLNHLPKDFEKSVSVSVSVSSQHPITSPGRPDLLKKLPSGPQTGVLLVEVVDSGAGIKAEDQTLLFAEAVQIDAGKLQGGGGSGLGLYNSRRIVEMHGGGMGMRSEGTGKGCTFFFWLPLYHPNAHPPDPDEAMCIPESPKIASSPLEQDSTSSSKNQFNFTNESSHTPHSALPPASPFSSSSGEHSKTDPFSSMKKLIGFSNSNSNNSSTYSQQPSQPEYLYQKHQIDSQALRYHFLLHSIQFPKQVSTLNLNFFQSPTLTPSHTLPSNTFQKHLRVSPHFQLSSSSPSLSSDSLVHFLPPSSSTLSVHSPSLLPVSSDLLPTIIQSHSQSLSLSPNSPNDSYLLIPTHHLPRPAHLLPLPFIQIPSLSLDISLSACLSLSSDPSPALSRLVLSSVLLVEDSDLVRKLTRKTLETGKSGNICFEARNGREAVEIVRERIRAANFAATSSILDAEKPPLKSASSSSFRNLKFNPDLSDEEKERENDLEKQCEPSLNRESSPEKISLINKGIQRNPSQLNKVSMFSPPTPLPPGDTNNPAPLQPSTDLPPSSPPTSDTQHQQMSVPFVSPPHLFSGEFGLVLMDSVMPEMSGPEATQALREMGYRGLIVGLTGNAMEEDTAHFKALGASAVLAKPLDYQQLVQVVRKYLQ